LSHCHDPCYLDSVYARGGYELKNCTAFRGNVNCGKCKHSVDYHGHTFEVTKEVEVDNFVEEPYTEY